MASKREIVFLIFCVYGSLGLPTTTDSNSLVVSTTESTEETTETSTNNVKSKNEPAPQITEMDVNTNVSNRFASTLITSKVKNPATKAQQAIFSVILPESAYISKFVMEIGGKSYEAYVKEKEEAKQIYEEAVSSGLSAAHVAVSARDSNRFTVSVNVEAEGKATFYLTYEELLQRKNSQYEVIINIHPGQIVKHLDIKVNVNESRPLKFIKTPALRSGNEVSKNDHELEPNTDIKMINGTSAVVTFSPDVDQQRKFAEKLGKEKEDGLSGQFVVQYDVERDPKEGEILLNDGYFVHFFAPSDLQALPKQVVFVLDMSGSMSGIKMEKLKAAMNSILSDLNHEDVFSIIAFDDDIRVYDLATQNLTLLTAYTSPLEDQLKEISLPYSFPANENNVKIARDMVKDLEALGLTNIMGGLETALFLVQRESKNQPIIIFLTDGAANVGISAPDRIIERVHHLTGENKIPIFSLSFGEGADRDFLRKLSLKNLGFARHIYDAADADLQLKNFYNEISSPLLNNVTFEYVSDNVKELTKIDFPIFFAGGEIVVAGRYLGGDIVDPGFSPHVWGYGKEGRISIPSKVATPTGNLERLWAYLTIRQKLEDSKAAENKTILEKEALKIALKYSFVTPVSSLVVVKPNDTSGSAVNTEDASRQNQFYGFSAGRPVNRLGIPSVSLLSLSSSSSGFSGAGIRPLADPLPYPIPPVPRPTSHTSLLTQATSTTVSPSLNAIENLKSQLPWLNDILSPDDNVVLNGTTYSLGIGAVINSAYKACNVTSTDVKAIGFCGLLDKCPTTTNLIKDAKDYENYFCLLEGYAGVCCLPTF